MAGGVSWPKDIHKYVKQCQEAYQNLKSIEIQTLAANVAGNRYNQRTNTNANTSINMSTNAKTANYSKRFANFLYNCFSSIVLNPTVATYPAHSKATRLI